MPLKALKFKPGVNKENTSYSNEGTWYECDKIRFRQGTPEKIGGWTRISSATYLGICRSLTQWSSLAGYIFTGVGTNLKFYIESGGAYYDVTPLRATETLNAPFDTVNGSAVVTVHDTAHGGNTGDFVTFSGATTVAGLDLNHNYQMTVVDVDTYTITASANANATVSGGGGATVTAEYEVSVGNAVETPAAGWGAGFWGLGTWGIGTPGESRIRIWNAGNFGENLVYGPRGDTIYYWDGGLGTRGVKVSSMMGASNVPLYQDYLLVSDVSRFILLFGTNAYGSTDYDAMVVRWSDQESVINWTPSATTQAGDLRLSRGSKIISAIQTRQEILIFTDVAVYSLQYQGPPAVWGATLLGDNVSLIGPHGVAVAAGAAFWMGVDKFYMYDGVVKTLECDLLRYVFHDINQSQGDQCFAGTIEEFNEVWWFYCSNDSTEIDRYVVYNYIEKAWYYGTMRRSAWVSTGLVDVPVAADYDNNNLLYHETGVDDNSTGTPAAIESYISSAQFDLDDGDRFGFVWRMLPDLTFDGSTAANPQVTLSLIPMKASGSGYTSPASVGGSDSGAVTRTATVPVEAFTQQINIRVRGRQLIMKILSNQLGVNWQLGVPRMDVRTDGRR